jgi:hypothetical protein
MDGISQDVKALSSTSALTLTVTVKMLAVWAALILVDIQTEEVLHPPGNSSSSSSALQLGVGLGLPHNAPPFFLTPHLFPPSSNLHNPQVLLQVM